MSETVIKVENLSKRYVIRHAQQRERYATLRDSLANGVRSIGRRLRRSAHRGQTEEFWALKDVSFEVKRGEVVGIIGRNGAGKSTLLKILSRITEPTQGRIEIDGRVASLLEVGTGFHPELTGRENIYLNGSILGMSRSEIKRKFDEIVAFAEVEKFLDTPVKRYSSGMYVRLAFAVAAHLEPEILVVDEVLAVGDAAFQKKCLGKMGEVARGGRTVLFVSHNMAAVQSLCDPVLWLQIGRLVEQGPVANVIRQYLETDSEQLTEQIWTDGRAAPQDNFVRLCAVRLRPVTDVLPQALTVHDAFDLEFEYDVLQPGIRINLSIHVYNRDSLCAFNVTSFRESNWDGRPFPVGRLRTVCHVPGDLLNDGSHRVAVMFVRDTSIPLLKVPDALQFEISDTPADRGNWYGAWPGAVRPRLKWRTEQVNSTLLAVSPLDGKRE
jgi:lipopolysaccharide transport system ATP-binding protein